MISDNEALEITKKLEDANNIDIKKQLKMLQLQDILVKNIFTALSLKMEG